MQFDINNIDWTDIFKNIINEGFLNHKESTDYKKECALQFEIAKKLKARYPDIKIFLEGLMFSENSLNKVKEMDVFNKRIDITIIHNDDIYPIELKYRYRKKNSGGGQNNLQYGYLYDIYKIEQIQKLIGYKTGYCLFFTNMTCLYNEPKSKISDNCNCKNYRIFQGRKLYKKTKYKWFKNEVELTDEEMKTLKSKNTILQFENDYTLNWQELFTDESLKKFRLLITKIPK